MSRIPPRIASKMSVTKALNAMAGAGYVASKARIPESSGGGGGAGDMSKAVYDPTNVETDIFAYADQSEADAETAAAAYTDAEIAALDIDNLLPDQTGHAGEFLTTDGSTASWDTPAGGGGSSIVSFVVAEMSVSQTGVASSTATVVQYDTATINTGGHFNTSTYQWTPPAGYIIINAGIALASGNLAANEQQGHVYKNGTRIRVFGYNQQNINVPTKLLLNFFDLATGTDVYEIRVVAITTSGTATVTGTGVSGDASFFQGVCFG